MKWTFIKVVKTKKNDNNCVSSGDLATQRRIIANNSI